MKKSVLTLLGLISVTLAACSSGPKNAFSPWHGFIYEEEYRGVEVRQYKGEFTTLTQCMQMMQAMTVHSKYAYYCGYDCPDYANPNASLNCTKLMGSPLDALDIYKE